MIEFFADDDTLARLSARHASTVGRDHLYAGLALAWQMRQRDPRCALAMARELLPALSSAPAANSIPSAALSAAPAFASSCDAEVSVESLITRLHLICAETLWLQGELEPARESLATAWPGLRPNVDPLLEGDILWFESWQLREVGEHARSREVRSRLASAWARSSDTARQRIAGLREIYQLGFISRQASQHQLAQYEAEVGQDDRQAVLAWHEMARAIANGVSGRVSLATPAFLRAMTAAQRSGQSRLEILAALNIGWGFINLNDLEPGLQWTERALKRARETHITGLIGACLTQSGGVMVQLGRHEAGLKLLESALPLMGAGSHQESNNHLLLGNCCLQMGWSEDAARWFASAERSFQREGSPQGWLRARRGCAETLARQGRLDEARTKALETLALARDGGQSQQQVLTLCLLAELHESTPTTDAGTASAPVTGDELSYLEEALRVAESIEDYLLPVNLVDALARAYARRGRFEQAYAFSRRLTEVRDVVLSRQAHNRAAAFQIQLETDRLRQAAERLREQGEVERLRAAALAQTNATLEVLGAVGREITACVEVGSVFAALSRHVHALLDTHAFMIYVSAHDAQSLTLRWGVENLRPVPINEVVELSEPQRLIARCARERSDCVVDIGQPDPPQAGDEPSSTGSMMYTPLMVADRLLGVMSLRSLRPRAYGDRERAIFSALSSYGAIALVNAEALGALRHTQELLVRQNAELERLASTDRLTGLYNRRHLDLTLERECSDAERYGTGFTVLSLDLDHFKGINDRHGHPAGDGVLAAVGNVLKARMRGADVVGRWGGEEFMIVCPRTSLREATAMAESLRRLVEQCDFGPIGSCTTSIGLASWRPGDTASSLVARADRALYAAKALGRNRVVEADEALQL